MSKKKRLLSTFTFIILLIMAILMCSNILEYKEARIEYQSFFGRKTDIDVIFLGSSHMRNHVLPMELWKDTGISSYNWGYSNCTPAENYYLIQDILKYCNPKLVVIDVYGILEYEQYGNGKYRTDRIEQQHVQFDSFPVWSKAKYMASKDVFNDYKDNIDFVWNFIMYHNRWSELNRSDFDYDISTEKGANYLVSLGDNTYEPIPETEKMDIDTICYPYFLNTVKYLNDRGVDVLCVYLPYCAGEYQQRAANSVYDDLKGYENCTYINMLNLGLLNFETDVSKDIGHMNLSGALKITNYLGNYIKNNYSFTDYSNNEYWKNDYVDYYNYKISRLNDEMLLVNYLIALSDSDFDSELYFYDDSLFYNERLMMLCENADITPISSKVNIDNDYCASIIVRNHIDNKDILTVNFKYANENDLDMLDIVRE